MRRASAFVTCPSRSICCSEMRELVDVVRAYEALEREGKEAVLATVVATRGSTYRRAGARMLMTEDAWLAGAISGGCLEADVLRKAWWRTSHVSSALVTYDATAEAGGDGPGSFGPGGSGAPRGVPRRPHPDGRENPPPLPPR